MKITLNPSLGRLKIKSLSRILHHFYKPLHAQWPLLLKALAASMGAVLMQIAQPWPLKIIFDYILLQRPREGFISGLLNIFGENYFVEAGGICLIMVLITLLRSQFEYVRELSSARAGQRVVSSIRSYLYKHIQKLSLSFHDQSRSGDLLMRLTGDIVMLREMLVISLLSGLGNCLVLAGMIGIMFYKDLGLTLIALTVVPILFFITFKMSGRIKDASQRQRKKEGKVASLAHETIIGIRDVQAFSREKYEIKRFEKHNRGSLKAGLRATRLEAEMSRSVQMTLSAGTAMVILFGVKRVIGGGISPGDLLVFVSYMRGMYRPIGKLAQMIRRFAKAVACGERVVEVLEKKPKIIDRKNARPAPPFEGMIEFRNVTFSFKGNKPILKNMNFVIQPGETAAFVGPSGAGKSTIINLLLRFYEQAEGSILIDGKDIRDYTLESLRNQISPVLQENVLFGMSIRENISFGKPNARYEAVKKAAKKANILHFIESLPEGFETILGERGVTLSGGEKRRLAIARAVLTKSPILVLDEPTSGIDALSEKEVIDALKRLAENKTVLIISHSFSTIIEADQIFYIEDGKVTESGTHEELIDFQGKYFKQYLCQVNNRKNFNEDRVHSEIKVGSKIN